MVRGDRPWRARAADDHHGGLHGSQDDRRHSQPSIA